MIGYLPIIGRRRAERRLAEHDKRLALARREGPLALLTPGETRKLVGRGEGIDQLTGYVPALDRVTAAWQGVGRETERVWFNWPRSRWSALAVTAVKPELYDQENC